MTEYVVVLVSVCLLLAYASYVARDWLLFQYRLFSLIMSLPIP